MIVHVDDLIYLKRPEDWKYKVYSAGIRSYYDGTFKVAAFSPTEANKIINDYRKADSNNRNNSFAISNVIESDFYDFFSNEKGIVEDTIFYTG